MPDHSSAAREHALMQEITAPLETLPDDPLSLVDADFPTVMRGYDRHAVDDYVEQMSRLVAELHATRSPESAVRRALERVGDEVSGVLQRAHETAEQITAQSRRDAEDRLERARREAASLVEAAERRVRELDADADRVWADRSRIIADTEALSGQLLAVARDANARFPVEETRPPLLDHLAGPEPWTPEPESWAPEPGPSEGLDPEGTALPPGEATAEPDPLEDADPPEDREPGLTAEPGAPGALDEHEAAADPADEFARPQEPPESAGPPITSDAEDPTEPIDPTQRMSLSHDDSTRVIPPASDAAQRRQDG
ncbi:MAG TPA: DivIVA domain-containing protein [Solirubrobacteraceae bacterium]|nr:DivIVA domain-containing protein [Solirubrobacteraceae bacterium]